MCLQRGSETSDPHQDIDSSVIKNNIILTHKSFNKFIIGVMLKYFYWELVVPVTSYFLALYLFLYFYLFQYTGCYNLKINKLFPYLFLGTLITFLCGMIKLNMVQYGNLIITVTSIVQGITLYTSVLYNSVYLSYINYIVFCSIYQGMMTIARLDIFLQ